VINLCEEICKAVLGDEIGEMTALQLADYLKDIRDKAEKLDALEKLLRSSSQIHYDDVSALKYEIDQIIGYVGFRPLEESMNEEM